MSWLQTLMPKEDRFFELFGAHSRTILDGAIALRALLDGGDQVPRHCRAILEHEAAADTITREVLQSVRRIFITPFDRGDIKDLITSMDNAIDEMQQTAKAVTLFEFREFQPEMRGMGDAILECAGSGAGRHSAAPEHRHRSHPDRHAVRADNRDRRPGRRHPQRGPAQALSGARQVGPDGFRHGQGDLRSPRNGGRLFRRIGNEIQSIVLEQA